MMIAINTSFSKAYDGFHGGPFAMKTRILTIVIGLACSMVPGLSQAMREKFDVLNPQTYHSPSGVYSLTVDPSHIYGVGPADYRFAKNGKTVWKKQLAYTFYDAVVTDVGTVAGYAYTKGMDGLLEGDRGKFIVAILSPEGKIIGEDKHVRESRHFPDYTPYPLVEGIILDESGNRFIVRIADPDFNRDIEQWWVYDLGGGKRIGIREPKKLMPDGKNISILDARAVPGTPLILVHWWKYVSPQSGAIFTLIDPDDDPVWDLTLDDDYTVPGNKKEEDRIWKMIRKDGAILEITKSPGFDIYLVKDGKHATFAITKLPDGTWKVRETARKPYQPAMPDGKKPEMPSFPVLKTKKRASVPLGDKAQKVTPLSHIGAFEFDAQGRIAALCFWNDVPPHLVLVSPKGDVLHDLQLPVEQNSKTFIHEKLAHVGGSRFIVTLSTGEVGERAACFHVDFDGPSVKKLPNFDCPTVTALAGFPDGRFAALTDEKSAYTSIPSLFFFDPQGKLLWSKVQDGYTGKPEDLLSPEDVTRFGDKTLAVLNKFGHEVLFLDVQGRFLRNIDLTETWKREPNEPTDIAANSDKGVVKK
jgi:hypothetical protein